MIAEIAKSRDYRSATRTAKTFIAISGDETVLTFESGSALNEVCGWSWDHFKSNMTSFDFLRGFVTG